MKNVILVILWALAGAVVGVFLGAWVHGSYFSSGERSVLGDIVVGNDIERFALYGAVFGIVLAFAIILGDLAKTKEKGNN